VAVPRRVLAVDGNALGHRAYRSAEVELDAGDERPLVTGAVVSMLATRGSTAPTTRCWSPSTTRTTVASCWRRSTRRTGRPRHRPLTAALRRLRDDLAGCGFVVEEHDGAEADDVLAATADLCPPRAGPATCSAPIGT
jgi:5'-3' exonuclease